MPLGCFNMSNHVDSSRFTKLLTHHRASKNASITTAKSMDTARQYR